MSNRIVSILDRKENDEGDSESHNSMKRPFFNLIEIIWLLWILALVASYLHHMLTLPGRWEKIVYFVQQFVR